MRVSLSHAAAVTTAIGLLIVAYLIFDSTRETSDVYPTEGRLAPPRSSPRRAAAPQPGRGGAEHRKLPSKNSPPAPQSDTYDWPRLRQDIVEFQQVAFDELTEEDWEERADYLLELADEIEQLPPEEQRRHLPLIFELLFQAGEASERANNPQWPRYGYIGEQVVLMGYYRAARLLLLNPDSLPGTTPVVVNYYLRGLRSGEIANIKPSNVTPHYWDPGAQ